MRVSALLTIARWGFGHPFTRVAILSAMHGSGAADHPASVIVPPLAGRPLQWTVAEQTVVGRTHPDALAHLGLRTASGECADALALVATGGRCDARSLQSTLHDRPAPVAEPGAAAALALLWSGSRDGGTLVDGARLYQQLLQQQRLPQVARHQQGAAQSLYLAGLTDELLAVLPSLHHIPHDVAHDLRIDLAHPDLGGPPTAWEQLLASRFVQAGLAPVTLLGPVSGHAFDALDSPATAGTARGPLVTVVVPAWQPDEGLLTSVRSLVAQTYADLEIVIVDDASGPQFADLFAAAAALDERVRVLTSTSNGGSYLARRMALERTVGEFVTTQDADDWSHPQRIEHQVAALSNRPGAPASRSLAVRARDDLTHQWFGYSSLRPNASSLMVRRSVLGVAGTFLPIRKGADSEYAERLVALLGPIADVQSPLAVTRLRAGSLSRGDFTLGWNHPDRIAFRGSYRAWHQRLIARADAAGPGAPASSVPAPTDADMPEVPAAFARGRHGVPVPPHRIDLVVLADFSAPVDTRDDLAWLTSPAPTGSGPGSIGLWHVERPAAERLGRTEMHRTWHDLVAGREDLHQVTRTHVAEVGTMLVQDPACLALAPAQRCAMRPNRVRLAVHEDQAAPGPAGLPVDLLGMRDAATRWWGVRPLWVAGPTADPDAVAEAFGGLGLTSAPSALSRG